MEYLLVLLSKITQTLFKNYKLLFVKYFKSCLSDKISKFNGSKSGKIQSKRKKIYLVLSYELLFYDIFECLFNLNWHHSGVDNQKDHYYKNEKQDDNGAYLPHVVSLQQFSQLCLNKVHFFHGIIHISI